MRTLPDKRPGGRRTAGAIAASCGVALVLCLWAVGQPRPWTSLEEDFERAGEHLSLISMEAPEGRAGQTIEFGLTDLAGHHLYLRSPDDSRQWVCVDAEGQVRTSHGRIAEIRESGELLLGPSGLALFADGVPVSTEPEPWESFWVSRRAADDLPKARPIPRITVRDDFMRKQLVEHPYARITGGTVELAQRGGGMPTTAAEVASYDFQRAVNPFAVRASDGGRLTYAVHTPDRWGDSHAEARFYFGKPKTGRVVDRQSLPVDTDLLVVMGPVQGTQVAFGWSGAERCFVLQTRSADGPWRVLSRWGEKRPPVTNWVTIGLECRQGHRVDGFLDGVCVLSAELPVRLRGPFHVQVGTGLAEFDDVRAWSLPTLSPEPALLSIRSRQFAGKNRKPKADPGEFDEWAASSDAFEKAQWQDAGSGARYAGIVTRGGILGDFVCESPASSPAGEIPGVVYRIGVYASSADGAANIESSSPICVLRALRDENGWLIKKRGDGFSGPDADVVQPILVVGRRSDKENRFCMRTAGRWQALSEPVPGAVHLAVVRSLPAETGQRFLLPPDPDQHVVRCTNLVHELFEESATAWNWVDGAFRMDCRWACQDQWNFMACGSTGLPHMTSKRVFRGDQTHEAFMSLRATFPWDAGDTTFEYDAAVDRANKFPILIAARGWYNRHDLNVSFCSDGRNPLSGYSVVFGGENNTVTRLLRRGVPVAESRAPSHLFPREPSFIVVHWPWWKFTVNKTGARIRVELDGKPLFDYTDPDPIDGGHLGFWSIRNGFAISRISSMAENIDWVPHASYVTDGDSDVWAPLVRDAVSLCTSSSTGLTQVTNPFGGGFFAVRHVPPSPVDLRQTPRLTLPLTLGADAKVNLHLEIGGKPFVVRIGDTPLSGMKALLVPGFEKGECFQLSVIPESDVRAKHLLDEIPRDGPTIEVDLFAALQKLTHGAVEPVLTCMTVGNTSNAGYLMAGHGGNGAGATYTVGPPSFSK